MARIDFTFQDEAGTNLNRFKATREDDNTSYYVTLTREANIQKQGTPLNAENLNKLISSINSIYDTQVTGVKGDSEQSFRKGNVNITKANIGLGNVDNIADQNKSVWFAESALILADDTSGETGVNKGSNYIPIYFENGKPKPCDISGVYNCNVYLNNTIATNSSFEFELYYIPSTKYYPNPNFLIFEVQTNRNDNAIISTFCLYDTFINSSASNPIGLEFDSSRKLVIYAESKAQFASNRRGWKCRIKTAEGIKTINKIKAVYLYSMS